jgi:hypothetical protein
MLTKGSGNIMWAKPHMLTKGSGQWPHNVHKGQWPPNVDKGWRPHIVDKMFGVEDQEMTLRQLH